VKVSRVHLTTGTDPVAMIGSVPTTRCSVDEDRAIPPRWTMLPEVPYRARAAASRTKRSPVLLAAEARRSGRSQLTPAHTNAAQSRLRVHPDRPSTVSNAVAKSVATCHRDQQYSSRSSLLPCTSAGMRSIMIWCPPGQAKRFVRRQTARGACGEVCRTAR